MRIVVAADKFKGSLDAPGVCAAMTAGVRRAAPEAEVDLCPMADGGEGTADALAAGGGTVVERHVCGPLPGSRVLGRITLLDDGRTAVLDMASAAGITLLAPDQLDPTRTTTYGVGELVRYAIEMGCHRVIVGLGGSATCDGGLGAAQALGLHIFLDGDRTPASQPLTGGDLGRVTYLDIPTLGTAARVTCLCDVTNPLLGPHGAAAVYGPQKGATPEQVGQLDAGLRNLARVSRRLPLAEEPGMGAAGGLAFGLSMATKADLRPGVDAVCDACGLEDRLGQTQLCLTGEGRYDAQSLSGKVVSGVTRRCDDADVPCVVIAGGVDPEAAADGPCAAFSIAPGPATLADLTARAADLVALSAEHVVRLTLAVAGSGAVERRRLDL